MSLSKPPVVTQKPYFPKFYQVVQTQSPPVDNQWYTLLEETNVHLLLMTLKQTNGESANKSLQVRMTIDGTVYTGGLVSVAHNTTVYVALTSSGVPTSITTGNQNVGKYDSVKAQSIKVEYRLGDTGGTGQTLTANLSYMKLEEATV